MDPYAKEYFARRDVPCPRCGFSLHGLTELRCPECGQWLRLQQFRDRGVLLRHHRRRTSLPMYIAAGWFTLWVALSSQTPGTAILVLLLGAPALYITSRLVRSIERRRFWWSR